MYAVLCDSVSVCGVVVCMLNAVRIFHPTLTSFYDMEMYIVIGIA